MKKFMKKKVSLFGKSVSVFAIVMVAMIGLATAALVPYISNALVGDVNVDSPIELVDIDFNFDIDYSGEDGFALLSITNNADVPITGTPEISIYEDRAVMTDMDGINVAITEDISYCFKDDGDMTGIATPADCATEYMTWMANNIDWNDWAGNAAYSDDAYPSLLVVNTNDDSFAGVGYTGNMLSLGSATIPAGMTAYYVVYVSTAPALRPADYDIKVAIAA